MNARFVRTFYVFLVSTFLIFPRFSSGQSTVNFDVDISTSSYSIISTLALPGNKVGILAATPDYNTVYLWVYNSSGTRITNANITSLITWPSSEKIYTEFNAIVMNNGNIFITFNPYTGDWKLTDNARFIIINESGALQSSGQVNTTDPGDSFTRFLQLVKLSNGRILVVFQRADNLSHAFRIFNENGTAFTPNDVIFGGPGSPNTFGGEVVYNGRAGAFKNGNFLVSLYYYEGNLCGFLFDNDGNLIQVGGSNYFILDNTFSSEFNNKGMLSLANGNMAVIWSLYGTHYYRIVNNNGGTVQGLQTLPATSYYMSNFMPCNTPGAEGFYCLESIPQDEMDWSNPNSSAYIKKYNQTGAWQSTTSLQGTLIAPSFYAIPGASGGYAYVYSYYRSYIPYPEDWDYDLTSDNDVKGVTIGFSMSTLPVDLTNFTVRLLSNKKAQLTWSTASESNNDYFEVEKSIDGRNFVSIGRVDAVGNSNAVSSYSFIDPETVTQKTWYRLKQVDLDGKEKSLGVRVVQTAGAAVSVYPNPVKGNSITINTGDETLPASYQLSDTQGRIMKKGVLRQSQEQLDVQDLPAGIYFLRIGEGQIIKIKK